MNLVNREVGARGRRISFERDGREVGRAYLYVLYNDLHKEPFGFLEDVHVDPSTRGTGVGSALVKAIIEEAKKSGCYKLICTSRYSRPEVHRWYERLGFEDHGKEFRMNF